MSCVGKRSVRFEPHDYHRKGTARGSEDRGTDFFACDTVAMYRNCVPDRGVKTEHAEIDEKRRFGVALRLMLDGRRGGLAVSGCQPGKMSS